jgi:hypothetical protein
MAAAKQEIAPCVWIRENQTWALSELVVAAVWVDCRYRTEYSHCTVTQYSTS